MTEKAGFRELRQNLSKYLERVKEGARVVVTERGKPVAILAPLEGANDPISRLERRGLIARRAEGSIDDLPAPVPPRSGLPTISEILDEQREDRI